MDQLGVVESISCKCMNKMEKDCDSMKDKDFVHLSSPQPALDNGGTSLSPTTPYSNKENVDLMSNFTSPLALISSSPTIEVLSHSRLSGYYTCMNEDDDSPCTPREGVFDPFAPGPDKLMLAPYCTKYLEESRSYVARRLNFTSLMTDNGCAKEDVSETQSEDDSVLEAVYDTLLETIISKQAEDILAQMSALPDVLKTPPSAPRLTGIADTCPAAPLKPARKSRTIDLSLCRKLEFDLEV